MRVALYARVSTNDQSCEMQLGALRELASARGWGVIGAYVDTGISGAKDRRPALDRLMRDVHAGKVDIVAVWKFDRFARSVRHLVTALDDFRDRGVSFVSVQDQIDTSTATGRLMFGIIASFAAFERDVIAERTRAGLAAARRRGQRLGRPRARVDIGKALALRGAGRPLRAIATELGIGLATLHGALAEHERARSENVV
jgi:DNA invertase Pin-like site-specific DNA recombinase